MTDRIARLKASPSVAVKEKLDYPVIDTDIHTNDYAPALEDFVATYGGAKLVDDLRKALSSRRRNAENSSGKDWYSQTPEERQHHRTVRSPWWARVTRNTLDVATYHLPELLAERLEEQGSDYSVLFPNNTLAPLAVKDPGARQALQRAINHYHADLFRKYSDRLTPVAGIPLNTPQEGIEELEFAVKKLGLKMLDEHATHASGGMGIEAGITEMLERMQTGRFKVFRGQEQWMEEFRYYRREEGLIVKERDDLISSTRYAIMMRRSARQSPYVARVKPRRKCSAWAA